MRRRICWPNPDATCLEGGCSHCNDHPFRLVREIRAYAETAGELLNRAIGSKDALTAFRFGERFDWNNAETRRS